MNWRRYQNGAGWQLAPTGHIMCETEPEAHGLQGRRLDGHPGWLYRTKGEPKSMRQLLTDFGLELEEASACFELELPLLMACIGIESTRLRGDRLRFDPRCVREEPGYLSDARTPNKVSPGLMQTLLRTAQDMLPRVPYLPDGVLTREDLFVPRYSIGLGAAYMRWQMDRLESDEEWPNDPILNCVAAYNAGSVRYTPHNRWHLITYSDTRIDRFIAWHNDALEVING